MADATESAVRSVTRAVSAHGTLLMIIAVAFATRLGWLLYARPEPVSDYQVYYALAETLLDERFFGLDGPSAFWLPGYPWLLAALMVISRSALWLSLVSVVLATAACPLVYLLTDRLTHRPRLALLAAGVFAVMPGLVLYAPVLATEHLFTILFLSSVLMALRITGGSWYLAAGTGVVAGFAALTRGEMLFYIPVVVGLVWVGSGVREVRRRLLLSATILGGLLIVVTPWMIRNVVVVDAGPSLSTVGGMNFYFGHRADGYGFTTDVPWPPGDDLEANRIGWSEGLRYIRDRPVAVLESARDGTYAWLESPEYALIWTTSRPDPEVFLSWERVHVAFEGTLFRILILSSAVSLSLAAAAFVVWPQWPTRLRLFAAGVILLNWVGYAVLFFGHPRFRYTVDVVATILVAITISTLWQARREPTPHA